MVGSVRSFPKGLALVGLGFLLALVVSGGAGSGLIAGLLFLPLLMLKLAFMFLLFGALFSFVRRGGFPGGHRRRYAGPGRDGRRGWPGGDGSQWWYKGQPMSRPRSEDRVRDDRDDDRREWEEHLRQARREVDDLDTPFTDPGAERR